MGLILFIQRKHNRNLFAALLCDRSTGLQSVPCGHCWFYIWFEGPHLASTVHFDLDFSAGCLFNYSNFSEALDCISSWHQHLRGYLFLSNTRLRNLLKQMNISCSFAVLCSVMFHCPFNFLQSFTFHGSDRVGVEADLVAIPSKFLTVQWLLYQIM